MALLTIQEVPITGLDDVVFVAADVAGDSAASGVGVALLVQNDDVGAHTVTVTTPGTFRGLAIEDPILNVAANDLAIVPLVGQVFGATATWVYDAVTSVTVAVVRLER